MIYLDHAATTPVLPAAARFGAELWSEAFANPSSPHGGGRRVRSALEEARGRVAALIGASPEEIVFTSGGTEADNLAIIGAARSMARQGLGRHIITSAIEHRAILDPCRRLEEDGFRVTYVPVDARGVVDARQVAESVGEDTILISIMLANNELGTVQPVADIVRLVREAAAGRRPAPLIHSDGVQVPAVLPVDVEALGVDMFSLSAHKFYGPKGAGALYIRGGRRRFIDPLFYGGGQEGRMRPGTENAPAIVAMGVAAEEALENREKDRRELGRLRDMLQKILQQGIEGLRVNGLGAERLPGHLHVSIPGTDTDTLLIRLDMAGIAASGGSACSTGAVELSHVLQAVEAARREEDADGIDDDGVTRGHLRLTLGRLNDEDDIRRAGKIIVRIAGEVRTGPGRRKVRTYE